MNDTLKKLLTRLGLDMPEETSDDDAIEKIMAMVTGTPKEQAVIASASILAALGLAQTATEAEVKGKVLALTHRADVVPAEQFHALKAEMHKRDITDTIEGGLREGKLTPAERAWATTEATKDLPAFLAFLAHRPTVVPLQTQPPPAPPHKDAPLEDAQAAINKQMGLSPAVFAKYATS